MHKSEQEQNMESMGRQVQNMESLSEQEQNMKPAVKTGGLIHIYCGAGKGKTTASIGLIARAAGHGRRVLLVQFLKDGHSGEIDSLRMLPGVQVLAGQVTTKFTYQMDVEEQLATRSLHESFFQQAADQAHAGLVDLLVLDEVLGAINTGLLQNEEVLDFLRSKPSELEVVLTGRDPSSQLLELADYISEIHCVRHPYQRGICAREGIEY